ncbi:MAG: NAD(P)H-dependent oxidoreductase subunit E [Planctomycetota bacterium]|nr:MAG: NAD(P)H-dependent oxidoreductase subunit E [Planctomycetota bacterium]
MALVFSEKAQASYEKLLKRYVDKQAVLLPVLYIAQDEFGWLSDDALKATAELTGTPEAVVRATATFYTMFDKKQVGKHHIQVCTNVSCDIVGSEAILRHLEEKLGIKAGETSVDKKYTLSEVECLGACGYGPMMEITSRGAPGEEIKDEYYENLTVEKVDEILGTLL